LGTTGFFLPGLKPLFSNIQLSRETGLDQAMAPVAGFVFYIGLMRFWRFRYLKKNGFGSWNWRF
jgi:hypothetical protein